MINLTGSAVHAAHSKKRLNIFTFPTHERNQGLFRDVDANFWMFRTNGIKEWNFKYGPLPPNHFLPPANTMPQWVDFDVLLAQNKVGQFQICKQLQTAIYLPIVVMEHTMPPPNLTKDALLQHKEAFRGEVNMFITEYSRDAWMFKPSESIVVPHAIDTDFFKPSNIQRENTVLTVANDYINRDWCLNFSQYQRVMRGLPARPVGDTPGFSRPANNIQELVKHYQSCKIFLNTAHISPVPMSLLEAMACGCAVVSCNTCAIPEYIHNGYNGLLANNDEEMRSHLERLLVDNQLAKKLGENARATIVSKCNLTQFTNTWNNIFRNIV